MLDLFGRKSSRTCDGASRRNFLKIGTLGLGASGLGALGLPDLLRARAAANEQGQATKDTSVVWLWLGGGPTHVETFDPKMTAPAEYRSMVGEVSTTLPGVTIGGLFPKIAQLSNHMSYVRSFAHSNSGHGGGTHYVMTGYDYPPADANFPPVKPSLGSIVSRYRGASHPVTGIPTYVRMNGIYGDGAAWLGASNGPFDSGGEARQNMNVQVQVDRIGDRRGLLQGLDRINRDADRTGLMKGLDSFEGQAFDLVLGRSKDAFDLNREDPRLRAKYGGGLGEQMLLARRLCEVGTGFVTIHFGGWDMHAQIVPGLKSLCPQVDQAVSTFVDDVVQRGLDKQILLVISGEFGRTPRINPSAGRDHWAPLSTLAFACGGLHNGQVIGESNAKVEVPASHPIGPQDMMATIFHTLGIDRDLHYYDQSGRPTPMIERGKPIRELVG
ncbi:MAG: DUF1501 domain-containing protein [Planctomycetaceae bacterium]|nr:DUF1501 domain-containing protein [Planctomycetaceae bacterium]